MGSESLPDGPDSRILCPLRISPMGEADPIHRLNTALEGRYHIERELGEGGVAKVHLGRKR